jgi:hypothetical protein
MWRYLIKWLRNPGSNRALVFCTPHTPSHPGRQGQQQCGLGCPWPVILRQQVPRGINDARVVNVVVVIRGGGGGVARRLAEFLAGAMRTGVLLSWRYVGYLQSFTFCGKKAR